ncbi:MAG TPA: anti-sigma F factor [Candidatus Ventricola intestinavium]|nr:anti-sigma F factor [Candidatus Ventricola intestinavium]
MNNHMELTFSAVAENEAFARMVISAFLMQANPTLSLVSEVRTAVSEAVTNAVVHAYGESGGDIVLRATLHGRRVDVEVEDFGRGIEDIHQAMQPFYTSQPEKERTGMGFALMQSFMDELTVHSAPGSGTVVRMCKNLDEIPA